MNKTLYALMTKLKWQLNDIDLQLLSLSNQLEQIEQQMQENQKKIHNASLPSSFILPEREIAGLHFIMNQQQQQDELQASKTALLAEQNTLNNKKIRLNTEIKMLEKYQERQVKTAQKDALVQQQNSTDEWVVQRRTSA